MTERIADYTGYSSDDEVHLDFARDPASSTQKWLAVDGLPGQRWRLPDDANLDLLEMQIKAAMRSGDAVTIEVVSPSCHSRIVLNGHALPFVVLFEAREPSQPAT